MFRIIALVILSVFVRGIFGGSAHALPSNDPKNIVFTDPLYEEWKDTWQSGTTALYDLDTKKGEVKDVCGKVTGWSVGHAYDGHQGWDRNIPNDNGVYPVFSIGPGVVEKMADDCIKGNKGCHGGAGNYVFIRHNASVVSKFFHLVQGKVFVKSSQWVDRFYPIGLGGSTGNSDGEHVHVQIEIDGVPVDPIALAAQWSPPLVVDENSCNVDPQHNLIQYQSLDQFVAERFKAFSTTLNSSGYALSKKKYWLLDSHGVDNKDLIIEEYSKGGDKSALVYDLVGHGSQAIFMPHAVLKWWFEQGSVYGYGKPLASAALASGPNIYTTQFYFEKGFVTVTSSTPEISSSLDDPNQTLIASAYPDNVVPGMFIDGWYAGKSYAFINSYVKNGGSKKVGYPTTQNSTTPFVHDWSGYSVQVFSGGSLGKCGIMLQKTNDNFQAFLIPGKIWTTYHAPTQGPDIFGAPINDVYFDTQFAMNRQDFEKGMSILESGEVITSSNQCPDVDITSTGFSCKCPGSTKQSSCGKCGFQKWSCINYMWTQTNTCTSQGPCTPGEQESQICGKCSNGTKTRTCMSNCIWNTWSSCADPDSQKICCEASMNDCGGCKPLTAKLYSSCGTNGTYECDGKDSVICKEVPISNPPPNTPDVVSSPDITNYSDTTNSPDAGSASDTQVTQPQPDTYNAPDTYTPPPNDSPDVYTSPDIYTPPPNYNACGGTSALQATPGTSCGNCGGTWQCSGANSVTCANTKAYTYDSQKACGPKYCLQIAGVSGSYATVKLTKMSGNAFGNMPLEWMVASSNPTKVLATPGTPFCTSLYNGQAEISTSINLTTMSSQMQVQAKFWSDLNCGAYEITPSVVIQKCN